MTGSTIGKIFTVTTAGESHGPALLAIVDGTPPGIKLTKSEIQAELDRRRPGQSKYTTQRREADEVEILSGVFENHTTGTPIGLIIRNMDQRSRDYSEIKNKFRPSHADYTYQQKFGLRDYRGGGRSSARETAMRVAAGAIAKKVLKTLFGVKIRGCMTQMGEISCAIKDWDAVETNQFFCAEPERITELEAKIVALRRAGDSVGAKISVIASGMPPGWGAPVFDRLDASIAQALMSINAVKAVEIGAGRSVVESKGTDNRDEIAPNGFLSNNAGGVLGGISSGQDIEVHISLKPTSSITKPGRSVNQEGHSVEIVTKGRHDPCVGIRATPIAEAMLAIVLLDHALINRGQCGHVISKTPLIPGKI